MDCVAIIPARGGSKGIPGKNLKPIQGRSLLQRAIEAAAHSSRVSAVYVTSDDGEILAEAERLGAIPITRPPELATDTATSESALLHALDEIAKSDKLAAYTLFVQCTSPFIEASDVDGLFASLEKEQADCALTVTPFHGFLWKPGPNGAEAVGHEKHVRPRRQDREPIFLETGAAYLMHTEQFRDIRHRFFGTVAYHVIEPIRSIEIDEPLDLKIAQSISADLGPQTNVADYMPNGVQALLLDFDGVLTDDLAIVREDGLESVTVSRSDGMGLERLRKLTDVRVAVISKETNPVVAARCAKLKTECVQGVEDKATTLKQWAADNQIDLSRVIYVGNDVNDLPVFPLVGLAVSPSDGRDEVKAEAKLVLDEKGGQGAVRAICEQIIAACGVR